MIISVTERGVFRRCKRQWDYSSLNRQALTPLMPPTALSFGGLIHKCHEEWLLHPDEPVQDVVMRVGAQGIRDIKERYKKVVGVEPDMVELGRYFEQVELALEMMNNYKERWGSSLPEGYTLLKPEQTLLIPIPDTEHQCVNPHEFNDTDCPECRGSGTARHYLEATLDALIQDEGGRLWVLERKTYANHPKLDVLQTNDQFLAYLWAIMQLDVGPVGGVFYDGMWKRKWEGKRTLDDLFMREPLLRSPEEINNFSSHVRNEALDMAQPDLRIYPNRAWTGCWDCQFQDLCLAEDREEDLSWIKARRYTTRDKHEWLEEAAD